MSTTLAGLPSASLEYREGGSDKVYHANVKPQGSGFVVEIAYGRRGASLNVGNKTPKPVPFDEAMKVYERVVLEKQRKGYVHSTTGGTVHVAPAVSAPEGPGCLLLNPIEEADADRYLNDPAYFAQQKFDGKRLTLVKRSDEVTGFNKLGKPVAVEQRMRECLLEYPYDVTLDCESWTDRAIAYDLLHLKKMDLRKRTTEERLGMLDDLHHWFSRWRPIALADTQRTLKTKRALFNALKQQGQEGIVFKDSRAVWHAGRPNSGGPFLKLKFWRSATVRVSREATGKQSVNMEMLADNGRWVDVGSLTIANSRALPKPGTYLEVKYLYAFPESNQLYQASEKERRDDVTDADCTLAQLKYKAEDFEL